MEDEILYKEITAIMGRSANNYLYRGSAVYMQLEAIQGLLTMLMDQL